MPKALYLYLVLQTTNDKTSIELLSLIYMSINIGDVQYVPYSFKYLDGSWIGNVPECFISTNK